MYKQIIRPLLFLLEPENVHNLLAGGLKTYSHIPWLRVFIRNLYKQQTTPYHWGDKIVNCRIGLSAGFDKQGELFDELSDFGFGFIEIGTITPSPQKGNPGPRIFRLPKYDSLISRTGFNNPGLDELNKHLQRSSRNYLLGININKNPESTGEVAINDILSLYKVLSPKADYFTINLPSPDDELFIQILEKLDQYKSSMFSNRPVLLKLSADIPEGAIEKVAGLVQRFHIDGVIATGPTADRSNIQNYTAEELAIYGAGGVSGRGIGNKSRRIVELLRRQLGKDVLIIGAGGIMTPEDALRMQAAGADLVQIYSAFIFSGPSVVKQMAKVI